jgi:hypothetical protein
MIRLLICTLLALLPGQSTGVSGVVVDSEGKPVSGAFVVVGASRATTGDDGRFAMEDVSPGKRTLQTTKSGFVSSSVPVTVTPGQPNAGVRVSLKSAGTITGLVFDSKGQPVSGVSVFPYRMTFGSSGERTTVLVSSGSGIVPGELPFRRTAVGRAAQVANEPTPSIDPGRTNNRGEFRISNLKSGEYRLYVAPPRPVNGPLGFLPFDYSSVVPVASGSEARVNIVAPASAGEAALRVRVFNESGLPDLIFAEVRRAGSPEPIVSSRLMGSKMLTDMGRFPTGAYVVEAYISSGGDIVAYTSSKVEMSGQSQDVDVTIKSRPGLKGSVSMEPADTQRSLPRLRFVLRSDDAPGMPLTVESRADGSFSLQNPPTGLFQIRSFAGVPDGMCLDLPRNGIELGMSETTLSLVLRDSEARLRGKVLDKAGEKVASAVVVLVPDNPTSVELYATASTDQNGDFDFGCVRAGAFRLHAWREMDGAAYKNAEFMRAYDANGTTLRITKGAQIQQNLTPEN